MRNPIDRIESHLNFINLKTDFRIEKFSDENIVSVSMYYKQLNQFRKVFENKDRYLILEFERMVQDESIVLEKFSKFLGLNNSYDLKDKRSHNKTPELKVDIWTDKIESTKNIIGRLMSSNQRRKIKRLLGWFTPQVDHREMTPSEKAEVREMLQADMTRFGREYGVDVSKWGF